MPTASQIFANCIAIAPEMALIATMLLVVLVDLAVLGRKSTGLSGWIAIAGLALSFVLLMQHDVATNPEPFSGALRIDSFALFFQKLFVLGAIAVCLFSTTSREIKGQSLGEYYALILTATLGAMLLAAANDFLILVLALETLSLSSYVLAGYLRVDRRSSEASIKYVLYGAVASGIMVFGFSYLYGMTGSMKLADAFAPLAGEGRPVAFVIASVMILAGVGFKISAVPFHNWTPDVYEGSPTPVTAFLAVVSKSAGFAVLIRFVMQAGVVGGEVEWAAVAARLSGAGFDILFWILAALTMTVGNFVALRQTNIKRLLGYSSIAHAGYLLMAFTVLNEQAIDAALFYFVVYYLMTLGAFYVAIALENHIGSCEMKDCRGMLAAAPFLVIAMVVFLVSLTGLPPMVGFTAKFKLFKVVVDAGLSDGSLRNHWFYFSLALIGVVNSVVSLYYYFKIVRAMALEKFETPPAVRLTIFDRVVMSVLAIAVIGLFVYVTPIIEFVQSAFGGISASVVAGGM